MSGIRRCWNWSITGRLTKSRERWPLDGLEQCARKDVGPPATTGFWGVLKEREGKQPETRAMIDVLLLGREYGAGPVRRAVEEALELGLFRT